MLRLHTTYYLLLVLAASISLNSSCSSCGKKGAAPGESPAQPLTIVNTLPFSTKEPAAYQADIVVSFPVGEAVSEQKYFTARDGETRRTDYELPGSETLSIVETPDGRRMILMPEKKCSTEDRSAPGGFVPSQSQSLKESLTTGWLAEEIPSNFSELGREELGGRQLTKYRVRFEKRGSVEDQSEALVWVDASIGMPVRTELYTIKNEQQTNKVITEFRNLKLSVDPGLFELPPGCQIIPSAEMQKLLRQKRTGTE